MATFATAALIRVGTQEFTRRQLASVYRQLTLGKTRSEVRHFLRTYHNKGLSSATYTALRSAFTPAELRAAQAYARGAREAGRIVRNPSLALPRFRSIARGFFDVYNPDTGELRRLHFTTRLNSTLDLQELQASIERQLELIRQAGSAAILQNIYIRSYELENPIGAVLS